MKTTKAISCQFITESKQTNLTPSPRNSEGLWKGIQLLLALFFMTSISKAQSNNIVIESGDASYYCGSVVTLIAPGDATNDYYWTTSGSLSLRPVNTTGQGFGALTVSGNNKVDVLVSGEGEVTVSCVSCGNPPPINLAPNARVFSPEMEVSEGGINQPNGFQTKRPWICLNNDLSAPAQVLTLKNDTPFDIFWSITGGARKVDQTYGKVGNKYVATVSIQTTGTLNKGFIRAYVSDTCGNVVCGGGSGIDWEILKNIVPDEIFGVTCLRDNNLDASRSTVYSVPDEIAGNAIFNWELYDNTYTLVMPNDLRFGIESTVLYGNSATITYKGNHTPSSVGNFKIKLINTCDETSVFERIITVSPEAPITTQETYCVPETVGTIETIGIANPESGKIYTWAVQGDLDWTITSTGNGATADVTFNDTASGIIIVKASNSNDPTCTSDGTIMYINRNGGDVSLSGVNCIQRGTTDAFSFTASPFGQFDWEITPSLPANWTVSNGGNILTVTPPSSGIDISGNYTVTASLQGCAIDNTASFDFEISPEKPVISGEICAIPGTVYTYTLSSEGATTADVTITTDSGTVTNRQLALPGTFNYSATSEDFEIMVVTKSVTNCTSLPTTLVVKAQPEVVSIDMEDVCTAKGGTPTITFTATTLGNITAYRWDYPRQWTKIGGGNIGDHSITLLLDENTAGDVCLKPYNDSCTGENYCLNVPRDELDVSFKKIELISNVLYQIQLNSETPVDLEWRDAERRVDVSDCIGSNYISSNSVTNDFWFYTPAQTTSRWLSVKVKDGDCSRCFVFDLENMPVASSGRSNGKRDVVSKTKFDLDIFPNPTSDYINIVVPSTEKVAGIVLVNAKGKLVFRKRPTGNVEKIDVSEYPAGMYFLYVMTAQNGFRTEKIIID